MLAASVFWTLALNRPFFARRACARRRRGGAAPWLFVAALALMLVALHALLLGLVGTRRTLKPLLALLTLVGVFAMHYMQAYGVVIDPSMAAQRAAHRHRRSARVVELAPGAGSAALRRAADCAAAAGAHRAAQPWRRALRERALLVVGAAMVLVAALLWQFQPLAAMIAQPQGDALPGDAG